MQDNPDGYPGLAAGKLNKRPRSAAVDTDETAGGRDQAVDPPMRDPQERQRRTFIQRDLGEAAASRAGT